MDESRRPFTGSKPKGVLVIGAGKRVCEDTLPVLEALGDRVRILGPFARAEKVIQTRNASYAVRPLDRLEATDLEAADLLYLAVSKHNVPAVLRFLARFSVHGKDLLVEPPVLLFKHLHHARKLRTFRNTWAAEDMITLPFMDTIRRGMEEGLVGTITRVECHRSAYKYHGLAWLKSLFRENRIRSARRKRENRDTFRRTLRFHGGKTAVLLEPRDYGRGSFVIHSTSGAVTDHPEHGNKGLLLIEPVRRGAQWTGFRLGDTETRLASEEIVLLGDTSPFPTLTPAMHALKRVGLFRLFRGIIDSGSAYPTAEALDDMVIDFWLDRVGFFPWGNRFSSHPLGMPILQTLSRFIP